MGQYYYPTIKKDRALEQFCSLDCDSGMKLTEHSYLGNRFVDAVLSSLIDEPGRLCWLGDYATKSDFDALGVKEETAKLMLAAMGMFCSKDSDPENLYLHYADCSPSETASEAFVVNHSKKEYVDLKLCRKFMPEDRFGMKLHPIPLLTAAGNGKGGGDYYGSNMGMVGRWCCDEIQLMPDVSSLKDYSDVTASCFFAEKN